MTTQRVRMTRTASGPAGSFLAGGVYDLDVQLAAAYIRAKAAEPVAVEPVRPVRPAPPVRQSEPSPVETTAAPPAPERAAPPPAKPKVRRGPPGVG